MCGDWGKKNPMENGKLGGGNSNIFGSFTPILGEDEPIFDGRIFFRWVGEKPPTRKKLLKKPTN